MKREVQAIVMLLLGTACIRIGLDGSYLYYVKPILRWPLIASGALVAAIGLLGLVAALRRPSEHPVAHRHVDDQHAEHRAEVTDHADDPEDGCGQGDHHHVPRVAWLLTLPVFAILLIAPGPLGAYAAARDPGTVAKPSGDIDFPPLPATDPAPLPVYEYAVRAIWDEGRSLFERDVELVGFASRNPAGGWYLTRIQLACCAADGIASKVEMRGVSMLPEDTWVRVVGRWEPATNPNPSEAIAAMRPTSVDRIPPPSDPYE